MNDRPGSTLARLVMLALIAVFIYGALSGTIHH
jgi:hypothetical protein